MPATSYRFSSYRAKGSLGGRVGSTGLALAIVMLVILALLRMGGLIERRDRQDRPLSTFDVQPQARSAARGERERQPRRVVRQQTPPPAPATRPAPVPPPPITPPLPVSVPAVPGMILLSPEEFAASDIGSKPRGQRSAESQGNANADSAAAYGPGEGPGGERLYDAEWVREPTRAEMVTYMGRTQPGWGMIACRTVERNRVENCRELGETPGSGIARGMRLAAWQFLVRPPRVGGRPQIGAWVRIRFDLIPTPEK